MDVFGPRIGPSLREFVDDLVGYSKHLSSIALPAKWYESGQFLGPEDYGALHCCSRAHADLFSVAIWGDSWSAPS